MPKSYTHLEDEIHTLASLIEFTMRVVRVAVPSPIIGPDGRKKAIVKTLKDLYLEEKTGVADRKGEEVDLHGSLPANED